MKAKKIVITGGPGTGKSSIIFELEKRGYTCLHEISRQVTLEAQKEGIDQLFLEQPLLFSEKLLEGRDAQYREAEASEQDLIFIDRGVHDVVAYMDYFNTKYDEPFISTCKQRKYEQVFMLPPWEEIYKSDNERYESFEEAEKISQFLSNTYINYGYKPLVVPTGTVKERADFILKHIER
ncbi:ATP-binding protein [Zunongwangia endophytica]|uniref:ATP-binding protein n=1 Tax=Zunongwangia endophytica TaxID=1808945 RepID=A0ABV8H3M5_9FLAO|nr:ATP-binding protein [Zunongwangia endophytica]MDN3594304.1 ATP-binding protein [Zunongwangia endophytica]